MPDMMRKLREFTTEKIDNFFNKNGFTDIKCTEYQLGKGDVEIPISSIGSSFTGEIRAKKENYMKDAGIFDKDTVIFKLEKGVVEEVKLLKARTDVSRGYIFLEDSIDNDNNVSKSKIHLNKEEEIVSLSLSYYDSKGYVMDEVTFGKNGNIDKYVLKEMGASAFQNFEAEYSWVDRSFTPIKEPSNLMSLESARIGMYNGLTALINGTYGVQLNDTQKEGIKACKDSLKLKSSFKIDYIDDKKNKNT